MTESVNKPLVSVIMPAYNSSKYICDSINSVISQTYGFENMEICIVDDKSTDDTAKVIEPFLNKYTNIHYYIQEQNQGPAKARNKAIEMAKGRFLAFLDSDDVFLNYKIEKQVEYMINCNAAFSCTDYIQVDEALNSLNKVIHCKKTCSYNDCVWYNPIGNSTVMLDTQKLGKVYLPEVSNREDYAMWLYLLREKTQYALGLQQVLTKYRIVKNSFSGNKFKMIKPQYYLYRKVENFSCIRAAFHVGVWCLVKILGIK